MDAATSTAKDYGYIGLFSVGKAWKRHVEGMVGSKVAQSDYLRAFNCSGSVRFGPYHPRNEVRAIVRLNAQQAMIMKLRHAGSNEAWVVPDEDGRAWGWLQFCNKPTDWNAHGIKYIGEFIIARLVRGDGLNFKFEALERNAQLLPKEWRRAFILTECHFAQHFDKPIEPLDDDPKVVAQLMQDPRHQNMVGIVTRHPDPAWHMPAETHGERIARQFWARCQVRHYREAVGVDAIVLADNLFEGL